MEDEEEVEREKRRKVRGSSSAGDPEDDLGETPRDMPTRDSTSGTDSTSETSQGLSGYFSLCSVWTKLLECLDSVDTGLFHLCFFAADYFSTSFSVLFCVSPFYIIYIHRIIIHIISNHREDITTIVW